MKKYLVSAAALSLALASFVAYAGAAAPEAGAAKAADPFYESVKKYCTDLGTQNIASKGKNEAIFHDEECLLWGSPDFAKRKEYTATKEHADECEAVRALQESEIKAGHKVSYNANCFNRIPEIPNGKVEQPVSEVTKGRLRPFYGN